MDDTRLLKAWVIGGDGRYPWAVRALRREGLPVKTYQVPGLPDEARSLQAALTGADLVLLPMKPFQGENLKIGEETLEAALLPLVLSPGAVVMAGAVPEETEAWLQSQGLLCASFLELETYQMINGEVTAEGAVQYILQYTPRTLGGAKVLVLGWGRIGRLLSRKLRALGAEVTATARRPGQRAEIECLGMHADETGVYHRGLSQYDVVVNTIPAHVLSGAQARSLKKDCLLLELASPPGGFTPEAKEERTLVAAKGLPGLTAPETAGENLASAVWECLAGEGRTLE